MNVVDAQTRHSTTDLCAKIERLLLPTISLISLQIRLEHLLLSLKIGLRSFCAKIILDISMMVSYFFVHLKIYCSSFQILQVGIEVGVCLYSASARCSIF